MSVDGGVIRRKSPWEWSRGNQSSLEIETPLKTSPFTFRQASFRSLVAWFVALFLCLVCSAQGAITVQNYYRLGEEDEGAANGGVITTSKDSVGNKHLTAVNSPTYTNDVAAAAGL